MLSVHHPLIVLHTRSRGPGATSETFPTETEALLAFDSACDPASNREVRLWVNGELKRSWTCTTLPRRAA